MCLESWKLDYPTFSYKWTLRACLEVLAGERSYSYTLDRRPVLSSGGKVVLFDRARSFGRDAHGSVREEGDTRLASQISRINPGDQRGDKCRSQIALTSWNVKWRAQNFSVLLTSVFPVHTNSSITICCPGAPGSAGGSLVGAPRGGSFPVGAHTQIADGSWLGWVDEATN